MVSEWASKRVLEREREKTKVKKNKRRTVTPSNWFPYGMVCACIFFSSFLRFLFSNETFLRIAWLLLLLLLLLSSAALTFLAQHRHTQYMYWIYGLQSINRGNAKEDVGLSYFFLFFLFVSFGSVVCSIRSDIEFRKSQYWIWHVLSLTYLCNLFMHSVVLFPKKGTVSKGTACAICRMKNH